ncbi:unnamed protein product [Angiostrongylus costaricensis]|uniref:gluconokinase n=1 Tax=Angiostrongylus costaricensis TaxID=334426 RepID=A0A0R3PCF2_ANGCS|nr:unnamed protein product [Angiostrongylus costaricensis]
MDVDVIFVIGVSGCGKTTVGRQLAARIGYTYKDGDDFHSESNLAKMKAGIPLNDEDRMPWLTSIGEYCRTHKNVVISCSALRVQYRNILRKNVRCRFIFLNVTSILCESPLNPPSPCCFQQFYVFLPPDYSSLFLLYSFIFLFLRQLLETRLRKRVNHFMPTSLLDSQLATLEGPTKENDVVSITIQEEIPDLIEIILRYLGYR